MIRIHEILIFLQTLVVGILYLEVEALLGSLVVAGNQLEGHQEDHQNQVAGLQIQVVDHQVHLGLLFLQIRAAALLLGNLLGGSQTLLAVVDHQYQLLGRPGQQADLVPLASKFLFLLAEHLEHRLTQIDQVVQMGRTEEGLRHYS